MEINNYTIITEELEVSGGWDTTTVITIPITKIILEDGTSIEIKSEENNNNDSWSFNWD